MKRTIKRKATLFTVILLIAVMTFAMPMAAMAAAVTTVPDNVKLVTTTGDLTVSLPTNVPANYNVTAYEMLQLVVPNDSAMTTQMTNTEGSKNLYIVTDPWTAFFADAKTEYTANGSAIANSDTLYLRYDAANKKLTLSNTAPASAEVVNEDYIVIDNAQAGIVGGVTHLGRLDKNYFEADVVSRIASSDPLASETGASAARLFSDWAGRYVKDKSVAADSTAAKSGTTYTFSEMIYGYYLVMAADDGTNQSDRSVINQSILNVPDAQNVTLKATSIGKVDKSVGNHIDANKVNNGDTSKENNDTTRLASANDGKIDKITANIGDILTYTVESHIPSLTSFDLTKAQNEGKLLALTDAITESDFSTVIADKYVYILKDKMINQDFIPVTKTVNESNVEGLKMVATGTASGSSVTKEYKTVEIENKYYIVPSTKSNPTAIDAIGIINETDYDTTSKSNFFAVNFLLTKLKSEAIDGFNVTYTYHTELMGEAGNNNSTNSASITYANDPFATTYDNSEDNTTVYTYDLNLNKVFSDGSISNYAKVAFKLYSDDAKTHAISFVGSNGTYTRADSNDAAADKTDTLSVNSTDGKLSLHGLGEGTYYLEEQQNTDLTAAGFNIVNTITVVISAKSGSDITDSTNFDLFTDGTTKTTGSTVTLDTVELTVTPGNTDYAFQFDVVNPKGYRLPLTGEYGNWLLAISGLLLVAVGGTVIILVNRKKSGRGAA